MKEVTAIDILEMHSGLLPETIKKSYAWAIAAMNEYASRKVLESEVKESVNFPEGESNLNEVSPLNTAHPFTSDSLNKEDVLETHLPEFHDASLFLKNCIYAAMTEWASINQSEEVKMLKVCTGCGHLSCDEIPKGKACCPDSSYIPLRDYCEFSVYKPVLTPEKKFGNWIHESDYKQLQSENSTLRKQACGGWIKASERLSEDKYKSTWRELGNKNPISEYEISYFVPSGIMCTGIRKGLILYDNLEWYDSESPCPHEKRVRELEEGLERCLSRIDPKSKDTWDLKAILVAKQLLTKQQKVTITKTFTFITEDDSSTKAD